MLPSLEPARAKPEPEKNISGFTLPVPLLLILFIFTILTLYHAVVLPLGEADDETDHYQYLRFVARTGHPPFTEVERYEAGFKGGLAPLYYWLAAWPIALVGEKTQPDIRRVDAKPERHIPSDGLGINHVLHTLDEQWPWRGQILAWHLVRFLSLPFAWITIIATYALARRLYPHPPIIALGAAAFMAFLPRFVSSSAVINDDNLVFALTTLLLLVQVMILQSSSPVPRLFALFGALFGLALITKYFSLILIPEVIFTLVMTQVASRRPQLDRRVETEDRQFLPETAEDEHDAPRTTLQSQRPSAGASRLTLLPFFTALTLTAGPWFIFIILRFNRIPELGFIPGLAASLGEPQITEGLIGLLSGQAVRPVAATYPLAEWFGLLYRSFWFEYGWMQLFAPAWIYGLFTIFLICALIGHILDFTPQASERNRFVSGPTRHFSPITLLLALHLLLFITVVLARYILSATIDTGQGRHLYPALAVMALILSLGLYYFGFWILDFGFKIFPILSTHLLPTILKTLPAHSPPLSSIFYLLSFIFLFLLPAFSLHPSSFILPHYPLLPVTAVPPSDLPITYRHNLPFAEGLWLAGFDAPLTASAGDTLPVTLYWRAEREAQQDYLISFCLQDDNNLPVACWAGPFAAGRYPARAWETGDTLADTIFIPIPTCARLVNQRYYLHLEIWPLAATLAEPALDEMPVLQQTFAQPRIAIHADVSRPNILPQTADIWHGNHQLTQPTPFSLGQTLTWLNYANPSKNQSPRFIRQATGAFTAWSPLPALNTSLFLPCDDGPEPFAQAATFIAGPNLSPGPYFSDNPHAPPDLTLSLDLRQRAFAPLSSTLTFSHTLAPLSLELPDQPPINLEDWKTGGLRDLSNLPTFQPSALIPLTLRWQARRWMADPLIISLKLLDKDFNIGGERQASLGDRYPNVLWAPTEIIEETYPLRFQPNAPPGLYRLELSLLRQDKNLPDGYEYLPVTDSKTSLGNNLSPLTLRLLDPADGAPPPQPLIAYLGDSIQLTGYDLNRPSISNLQAPISLALYWQSTAKIPTDYTVFTQLIGPDGQVWAQWDNPPQAGRYPTSAWAAQDSVVDRYTLTPRSGAPPGQYRLLVGMYNPATGQRLPATLNGQPQPDNAIPLATLSLIP